MGWLAQCGVRRESLRVSVPGRRPETRYWTWFRASRLKTLPFCCSYEYTGGWVGAGPGSNLAWLGHPAAVLVTLAVPPGYGRAAAARESGSGVARGSTGGTSLGQDSSSQQPAAGPRALPATVHPVV